MFMIEHLIQSQFIALLLNKLENKRLVAELVGGANAVKEMGNFIITERKDTEAQKFNIDGFMFQSMVNSWAIDVIGGRNWHEISLNYFMQKTFKSRPITGLGTDHAHISK